MAPAKKTDSSKLTLPLMLGAFLIVGGFLYWLNISAKSVGVEVAEAVEEAPAEPGATGRTVQLAEVATAPAQFQGERVRLANLDVASRMGNFAFWVEAPGGNLFLVRMLPDVLAEGVSVTSSSFVTAEGLVHAMTDSVIDAWSAEGLITSDGQRAEASFAMAYLEADRVTVRDGSGGDDDGDDGDA